MKNFFQTLPWTQKLIFGVAVGAAGIFSLVVFVFGAEDQEPQASAGTSTAETISAINLSEQLNAETTVRASGRVASELEANISPQISGVVSRAPVNVGERVSRGEILLTLENDSQRASVSQARSSLEAAQAQYETLASGATEPEIASARANVEDAEIQLERAKEGLENARNSQGTSVKSAREAFLNTGLSTRLADASQSNSGDENFTPPTISGTYESTERGQYRIDLFASGAPSGYSFDYSGLESGTAVVSTSGSVPLGTRGLEIQFPSNFATGRNVEWIVSIPNKQAPGYVQAKNALEQARDGEDSALDEARRSVDSARVNLKRQEANLEQILNGATESELATRQAQVDQARASLESAQAGLSRTTIRAPFSGSVTSVSPKMGEYISPGSPVVSLVNKTQKQIQVSLSPSEASQISPGAEVRTEEGEVFARVASIGDGVTDTGKVEAVLVVNESTSQKSLVGEFITVEIVAEGSAEQTATVPLRAVRASGSGSVVYEIDGTVVREKRVETGNIVGESIEITSGLEGIERIAASARGLSDGQNVRVQ